MTACLTPSAALQLFELRKELDAVRAELAQAIEAYDAMKDSRDAAKLEADKLRAELADWKRMTGQEQQRTWKAKQQRDALLKAAKEAAYVLAGNTSSDESAYDALESLHAAIQAAERKDPT